MRKQTAKISILTMACAAIAPALMSQQLIAQQDDKNGFYVNPNAGFYRFDNDRNLDDTFFPALGVGYRFDNPWAMELNYLADTTDIDQAGAGKMDFEQLRLDALYHLQRRDNWQPYLAFGAGENDFSTSGFKADETVINVGGGFKFFLTEALSLRTDLRLFNSMDEEDQDVAISVGLHYQFGSSTRRAATGRSTETQTQQPADADNDGVPDNADQCLNTAAGTAVDARGCPVDDQPLDDGPLDSDGDGVVDAQDQCPTTEQGARVDADGCYIVLQETRTIELQINFANNSAVVTEEYFNQIQQVADFMREYPLTKVVVEGHTDDRGQADYNLDLSARRAQAVADILVERFTIAADRVSSVGKGEAEPIAPNDSADGRATNRRVVGVISALVEVRQ